MEFIKGKRYTYPFDELMEIDNAYRWKRKTTDPDQYCLINKSWMLTQSRKKLIIDDDLDSINCLGVSRKVSLLKLTDSIKELTENKHTLSRSFLGLMVVIDDEVGKVQQEDESKNSSRKFKIKNGSIKILSKIASIVNAELSLIVEKALSESFDSSVQDSSDVANLKRQPSSFINKRDGGDINIMSSQSSEYFKLSINESARKNSIRDENHQSFDTSSEDNITPKEVTTAFKKEKKTEDIIKSLVNEFYYDIQENYSNNFEAYIVNNLMIISFIEKALSKDIKDLSVPKLNSNDYSTLVGLDRTKKLLILDLDETLVHSDIQEEFNDHDFEAEIETESDLTTKLKVLVRPHTTEFLEYASKKFNLLLFTAGVKSYVDSIMKFIDPKDTYFKLKLYRDSCLEYNSFFIKDLNILSTFGLKDMILVDNCIFSFSRNLRNGVLVSSFYSNKEDIELLDLKDYLENSLLDAKDVREVNESVYGLDAIKSCLIHRLVNEGYII